MLNCQSINQSSTGLRPHSIIVFEFLMLYNNNRKRENEYQKVIIDDVFDMGVSALGFHEDIILDDDAVDVDRSSSRAATSFSYYMKYRNV
jgi:hypothetical protein